MCVCRNVRTGGTKHTSNSSLLLLLLLLRIVHFILGGRKSLFGETTASQKRPEYSDQSGKQGEVYLILTPAVVLGGGPRKRRQGMLCIPASLLFLFQHSIECILTRFQ